MDKWYWLSTTRRPSWIKCISPDDLRSTQWLKSKTSGVYSCDFSGALQLNVNTLTMMYEEKRSVLL